MAKKFFSVFLICLLVCLTISQHSLTIPAGVAAASASGAGTDKGKDKKDRDYIKWVEFNITYEALKDALALDIETYEQDLHLPWVESLAYLACRNGGNFSGYTKESLNRFAEARLSGSSMDDLTKDLSVYDYYYNAYDAVIGNLVGMREDGTYGLTAYSPVAAGYWYTESDDFGNSRSYGFARRHLGHDMFCSVGTPVSAIEDGKVEALGWNQYGGWRIGIRSGDGRRYYYYAHLRKDAPFAKGLCIGDSVSAGQIIGYTGQTGYSIKENVNNINVPHLHFGMQLIFDESQKECLSEIWINVYPLVRLLSSHRADPKAEGSASSAASAVSGGFPAETTPPVDLPILMYHGLTDEADRVNDYFVPAQTFAEDMKYLKENGYTAVTMTEVIDYVYDETGKVSLPDKPVVISFDDGYMNNHTFGTSLLEQYDMKAVISVIGSASDEMSETQYKNRTSCAASWEQISEMAQSGVWETQNHTYDFHDNRSGRTGARKAPGESFSDYEKLLRKDLSLTQQKIKKATGTAPNTFTWPYGAYTEDSCTLLKSMGFRASLSCAGGINKIQKGDKEGLFLLKRNIRKPNTDIRTCLP